MEVEAQGTRDKDKGRVRYLRGQTEGETDLTRTGIIYYLLNTIPWNNDVTLTLDKRLAREERREINHVTSRNMFDTHK